MKIKFICSAVLFLFFLSISINVKAQDDDPPESACGNFTFLNHVSGTTIEVEIKSASIPFEGLNRSSMTWAPLNRLFIPQTGSRAKYKFASNVRKFNNLMYHKFQLGAGSWGQFTESPTGDWDECVGDQVIGWGKYQITVRVVGTNEKYTFYWNNLDSKYATELWQGQNLYGRDWYFELKNNLPTNGRLVFEYEGGGTFIHDTLSTSDTLSNGLPSKEYKPWEIIYNRSTPWAQNFYARTTPFPITQ